MKRLAVVLLILPALAFAGDAVQSQTKRLLKSKVLQHTQLIAATSEWHVAADALDDDGDPEFELTRDRLEVSINETGTVPLVTIDAEEAVQNYFGMMKDMLKAEPRDWPEGVSKPEGSACLAFVTKLFAEPDETLDLNLTCFLAYRGGAAIVQAAIDAKANARDRARLSDVLASITLK